MDRRNALLALLVLLLFACEDEQDDCSKGCESNKVVSYSRWAWEKRLEGSVTWDDRIYTTSAGSIEARQDGFELFTGVDDVPSAADDGANEATDADAGADAASDASDGGDGAASEEATDPYDAGHASTGVRPVAAAFLSISFAPPPAPGRYALEEIRATATYCPFGTFEPSGAEDCSTRDGGRIARPQIPLKGFLVVQDPHTPDVSEPGAPKERPWPLPWSWDMDSTNPELEIHLHAESKVVIEVASGVCVDTTKW